MVGASYWILNQVQKVLFTQQLLQNEPIRTLHPLIVSFSSQLTYHEAATCDISGLRMG